MEPQSQRRFISTVTSQHLMQYQGEFSGNRTYLCIPTKPYIVVKKCVLYVFSSKSQWQKFHKIPSKFFNLNSCSVDIENPNEVYLENEIYQIRLSHFIEEEIEILQKVIENNRMKIRMEDLFPKKYHEIDENIEEKVKAMDQGRPQTQNQTQTKPEVYKETEEDSCKSRQ